MKYSQVVVVPPPTLPDPEPPPDGETRRRFRRSPAGKQFRKDVLDDLVRFHPFTGRMPRHRAELAEEIGARLTVLAVRTHVPWVGRPQPPVTLRMRHALRMLARSGGELGVGRLAEQVGTGVPAASQLVTRMQRRGLVRKQQTRHDRRGRTVILTRAGWRHVPRDEPPRRDPTFLARGRDGDIWGEGTLIGAWPRGLRRVQQPAGALEDGLERCAAVHPAQLLAGLRALQATIHGFDYELWEIDFDAAVSARRRLPRHRWTERTVIASLGRPTYGVAGRKRRPWARWRLLLD